MNKLAYATLALSSLLFSVTAVFAAQPVDWQIRLQPAATDMMRQIIGFEIYTLWFIIPITLFVLALLIYVGWKFHANRNSEPSKTTHNTMVEVVWTLGPVLILLAIAVPSFNILTQQLAPEEEPKITIKATGYQWYWGYEYQTENEVSFDALMLQEDERSDIGKEDIGVYPRLLAVDNEVVVPVNTQVRLIVTGADVIHSFAMPSFGIKIDAIPGRLNETWFNAEKQGLYYGQCSELCGKDHAFMPIAIRVVSQTQYDTWLAAAADDIENANNALMASIETGKTKFNLPRLKSIKR